MSQELKYKVGDRVRVTDSDPDFPGVIGWISEVDLGDTLLPYEVKFDGDCNWFGADVLTRAASSPDEQDIENAGGSDPVKPARFKVPFLPYVDPSEAPRDKTLRRAKELINGDRAKDYGDAAENFQRIADLWKPILGKDVTAVDVSLCLLQLKVARIITTNGHEDSWIDACGYLALGSEIAGGQK